MSDNFLQYANYLLSSVTGASTDEEISFDPKGLIGVRKTLATSFQQLYVDGLAIHHPKITHLQLSPLVE